MGREERLRRFNDAQRLELVRKVQAAQGYLIISSSIRRRIGQVLTGVLGGIGQLPMAVIAEASFDEWATQRRRYYSDEKQTDSPGVYYYKVKAE